VNARRKPLIQNKLPSVSVIVPTYNNGRFIKFALESLFDQTYPADLIEIIVVDDGSTDNTKETLDKYRERIIHISQNHRGISSARNAGISLAQHEIITFLDADDIWHKDRLLKIIERFNENKDVGIIYHPFEVIDNTGSTVHGNFYKFSGYTEDLCGWITKDIFSGKIFCGGSSFAFTKRIIDKVYPVPEDIKRGTDYYITAISSCYAPAAYIPDVLGKYRLHSRNTTMLAGHNSCKKLAMVNKDFAYMRQKVIQRVSNLNDYNNGEIDLIIIGRMKAKEEIFFNVLAGERFQGIKRIPALFKGKLSIQDFLKGTVVSFMALFVPAPFYPKLVRIYGSLKGLKLIKF
jgi:glycosyltransferase involved in cell wall biosynthesis